MLIATDYFGGQSFCSVFYIDDWNSENVPSHLRSPVCKVAEGTLLK